MRNRRRYISVAIFASLATVVGATLSWACTPATFGTPATPAAPPTPAPPQAASPGAGGVTGNATPPPAPVAVGVNSAEAPALSTSGAGSASGAERGLKNTATPRTNAPAPQGGFVPRRFAQRTGAVSNPGTATANFAQRAQGGTVGTTSRGGQAVFASSGAKKKAAGSKDARTAPSSRSAAGDLWSGFKPGQRSSVFSAEASAAGQDGGLSGTATAALAMLGLGLTGMAGAAGFLVVRGRRAKAQSTAGGSGTTEM